MKRYIFMILMLLSGLAGTLQAQIDSVFWFAPPYITSKHGHTPITIGISSYDQPVTVTISQPANSAMTPFTFNLGPNDFRRINISELGLTEANFTSAFGSTTNNGLLITSTGGTIGAYVLYAGNNSEGYVLKGQNALGKEFIVTTQNTFRSGQTNENTYGKVCRNYIEIVATEDNTEVWITPSKDIQDFNTGTGTATTIHSANTPYKVTLQKGQTYAIRSRYSTGTNHLGSTIITSNKPIAVNSTDDSVEGPAKSGYDLVGDQILPVEFAGTTYIGIKNGTTYLYVYATENGTKVYKNGSLVKTLNKGQYYTYQMGTKENATLITSDKPVICFCLTSEGDEFGGTVLPQLSCTGSHVVAFASMRVNPRITIITQTESVGDFTVSGTSTTLTASDFKTVPGDPSWSYCVKKLTAAKETPLRIANSTGLFHLGVFDIETGTMSYSYFSGYEKQSYVKIKADIVGGKLDLCQDDTIKMDVEGGYGVDKVAWSGPNDYYLEYDLAEEEEKHPRIHPALPEYSGEYILTGESKFGCEVESDTVEVTVIPNTFHYYQNRMWVLCIQ